MGLAEECVMENHAGSQPMPSSRKSSVRKSHKPLAQSWQCDLGFTTLEEEALRSAYEEEGTKEKYEKWMSQNLHGHNNK
eukprot:CAMPEP_0118704882 /NCGR_PEP_ID=MMETSP0800-20121206/19525_1 /TAXON_ID=210618 ORGANISM="Striatella unipunctata, Strain CCMP2910" /NCGR_SAMPLE_ID=MMETSP0800 /ASSEMBLY_ACC=CAM_ASM_000638 /LENGTH=78 /DNA_ID=CAMNT_0006606907 /DNA_START=83 /DNA_END=322 /DNA_ORIENTATION=+